MSNTKRTVIINFVLVTVSVGLIGVLRVSDPTPRYDGKSAVEWLALLERREPGHADEYEAARKAIQGMGPAVVPYLREILVPRPRKRGVGNRFRDLVREVVDRLDELGVVDRDKVADALAPLKPARGPSEITAAHALALIGPEGIVCLTNLLASGDRVAMWGLARERKSRNWPGVQATLVRWGRATNELGEMDGIDSLSCLARYGSDGDASTLVPLGVSYITNVTTDVPNLSSYLGQRPYSHYESAQQAGARLLASLVADEQRRTNVLHSLESPGTTAYGNAVLETLEYHSVGTSRLKLRFRGPLPGATVP